MTQEEKQLLFIDLCARLPYEVKVYSDAIPHEQILIGYIPDIERYNIKPYLRPMSSMTEEEVKKYKCMNDALDENYEVHIDNAYPAFDWLNSHHFDYRNLIKKGLALEAKEGMYKTE